MRIRWIACGATFIGAATLCGCASQLLSDERLRQNTAGILGVGPEEIVISDRTEQTPNTYYTATLRNGRKFTCLVNGGSVLAAGMVNPPSCSAKGQPLRDTNPLATH